MNIAITGQPRTDALFESKDYLSDLLEINIKKFDKVVIYMPTYRIGYGNQKDGRTFDSTNIFRLKSYVHKDFLNYLERNNILFLLKLHPYEETLYKEVALGKNIKWITNDILVEKELSIYNLLSNTDILITDYSSIYFDFLLLDKKIIFLPVDLDYYKKNRGFELEPYEFWTPGEKVFCIDDLEKAILIDDSELEKKQRKNICDIMFRNQDANSSERVFNQIRESYKDFA
jgi:CDP-glycerol glycerophosphotransferase (TagB/SpsB family)